MMWMDPGMEKTIALLEQMGVLVVVGVSWLRLEAHEPCGSVYRPF